MPRSRKDSREGGHEPARPKRTVAVNEARLRQQAIGSRLRELFDEVVNEPVPEEFLAILRRVDEPDGERGP